MKKYYYKLASILLIFSFVLSSLNITYAGNGGDEKAISPVYDNYNHGSLQWTVQGVGTQSVKQAFVIGWNLVFTAPGITPLNVYVPKDMSYWGSAAVTYIFPLTKDWRGASMYGIGKKSDGTQGTCIEDFVSDKVKYNSIITYATGFQVTANATIQKYAYDSTKPIGQKYSPYPATDNNIAKNYTELLSDFKEYSDEYLTNAKVYFDIDFAMKRQLPTPKVNLTMPLDGSTVLQGTTVTFKGFGTGVHHIGGFVDGVFYGTEQLNPNSDITTQMKYETTVKLDTLGKHTFYIVGRNTALSTDTGSETATSATYTVNVIAPAANTGNIYVTNLDDTNSVISSSSIPNVPYGTPKTISSSSLDGYDCQGSYQTFATTTPDKSKMTAATSQTVTLSSTNKDVYVYSWYKAEPVVVVPDCQVTENLYDTTVRAGEYLNVFGNANDTKGHTITGYYWTATGADEKVDNGNMTNLLYMTPGVYDLSLNVVCAANNVAFGTAKITVTEPKPQANINITGLTKENRKITIDGSGSSAPQKFPMDWTKTNWKIEPVTTTGAKWEMGVRLPDGTVRTINQSTDQSFLKGQTKFDFQARYAGQYKVTITVTNSKNLSSTTTNTITVVPDVAPIADFDGDTYVNRDQPNPLGRTYPTWAILRIYDKSTSPDGDTIKTRIWGYRYNKDNNKVNGNEDYSEDKTIYKYTGNLAAPFYKEESQRLVVENNNDLNIELWFYDVGAYVFKLTVVEDIPESETIKELLLDSDYRRGYAKDW